MNYTFIVNQTFRKGPGVTNEFDEFLDEVLDELYRLDIEADYLANLEEMTAQWTITVDGENSFEGMFYAASSLRTALHTASCVTDNWFTVAELKEIAELQENGIDLASA